MESLYSLGDDGWNEKQNDLFHHVMPVPVASQDAHSIINGTTEFFT